MGGLLQRAKASHCQAIFLVNESTLRHCVPGDRATLDDYRGSVLQNEIPIIVGNSLAQSHTVSYGGWLLNKDLAKIKTAKQPKQSLKFKVLETPDDMSDAFAILEQAVFMAYDIETRTVNNDAESLQAGQTLITCCSWTACLEDMSLKTFVLPMIDFGEEHWRTNKEYGDAILFMRKVNATDIPKAMHNGAYDAMHSAVYRAWVNNWVLDTMGLAHSQYSELPKDLSFVASITLPDYVQWKGEASAAHNDKDINRYWSYNALDTWYTARISLYYMYHLPAYARANYAATFPLVYPCIYCAFEGILIDNEERLRQLDTYESSMEKLLTKIRVMVADPNFNPSSPKQTAAMIYDVFGAKDPRIGKNAKTRKKNLRSTDSKNLTAVGTQHPILLRLTDAITNYKTDRKAVGTYFTFLQLNNRLMYSLDPFGTDTGRMAARSSSFWCGTQVQNIPMYAKPMLVADEGFILLEGDKSQSEARCTAYCSKDLALIKALEDKERDFYRVLGKKFFNIEYEDVTTHFRNKVLKKICHGTNYVMGAQTFIDNVGVAILLQAALDLGENVTMSTAPKTGQKTLKQFAHGLLEIYHVPFFRVREWYAEIKTEVASTHLLRSPLGHTRYFFGDIMKDHNMQRSAIAHQPQNLSVSILNKGFMNTWELVKKYPKDIRLKAQIHDSVFSQVREGRPDLNKLLEEALYDETIVHGKKMIIPNDFSYSKRWKEIK